MFPSPALTPEEFAQRFLKVIPGYLPGVDTGAFEPSDRRRCWNKTLQSVLSAMGKQQQSEAVVNPLIFVPRDQSCVLWKNSGAPVFTMMTGWGNREELEISLDWCFGFKCPQKLLVYTCTKWQDAVLDQIQTALSRYVYHLEGEHYLFMNLLGAENRFLVTAADISNTKSEIKLRSVPGSPFQWRSTNAA